MNDLVLPLDAAKLHLRVDSTDEDDLITDAIRTAQAWIEENTILVLTTREMTETANHLGGPIDLRAWPVSNITKITYFDRSGAPQELATGSWWANLSRRPVRLSPSFGTRWPASAVAPGSVAITFTAGFDTDDEIPATVMHAIKLLVSHFYTNRTPVAVGARAAAVEVPLTIADLVRKWRRKVI
ncbi:MAG TPA: head-tail connector protein [Rhizomicrobium sp.]|jgi:uncharacterized phiE125 gp8 family phage protein|nr:head-tail connector protein [Rhizomicrobium sp.]